jgi:hypothetical protein
MKKLTIVALLLFSARTAEAHFVLLEPATWSSQNSLGDPQKMEPCGGEGGTPTGDITTYMAGQTITLRWQETIYHPGHWRIALAENRDDFVDPVVTLDNNDVSIGAEIQNPPVAPVLMDGLFMRTGGGSAGTVFEQEITLPNTACAHCTIQVIQYMQGHGPPNYIYHHCADIEILAPPTPDAGVEMDAAIPDTGTSTGAPDTGMPRVDGGVVDTGTPQMDAGNGTPDSGVQPSVDAGQTGDVDGGCRCMAEQSRDGSGVFVLVIAMLAVLSRSIGTGTSRRDRSRGSR